MFGEKKRDDSITMTRRDLSIFFSVLILLGLIVFITGYFLGKKHAFEEYTKQIIQDEFADKVSHSTASMFKYIENEKVEDKIEKKKNLVKAEVPTLKKKESIQEQPSKQYYAQLIGFGTLKHANNFVDRVSRKGYHVILKKRKSKTAKGKLIKWYQIETERFNSKDLLLKIVDEIKRLENLKDVRII